MKEIEQLAGRIEDWLKERVQQAGAKGVVLGLSGGIDSAVVAYLAKRAFGSNVLGIVMPAHSNPQDEKDAIILAESGNISYTKVVLDNIFDSFLNAVDNQLPVTAMAVANVKPRLRMMTLYYYAAKHNYLVAGTGNRSEITVGYFTKYGDSGVDMLPIAGLVKRQVIELAKYLGVPDIIINKPPSAGLWEGQTDENEMGFSYGILEDYIYGREIDANLKSRIEKMDKSADHKRKFPPMFID